MKKTIAILLLVILSTQSAIAASSRQELLSQLFNILKNRTGEVLGVTYEIPRSIPSIIQSDVLTKLDVTKAYLQNNYSPSEIPQLMNSFALPYYNLIFLDKSFRPVVKNYHVSFYSQNGVDNAFNSIATKSEALKNTLLEISSIPTMNGDQWFKEIMWLVKRDQALAHISDLRTQLGYITNFIQSAPNYADRNLDYLEHQYITRNLEGSNNMLNYYEELNGLYLPARYPGNQLTKNILLSSAYPYLTDTINAVEPGIDRHFSSKHYSLLSIRGDISSMKLFGGDGQNQGMLIQYLNSAKSKLVNFRNPSNLPHNGEAITECNDNLDNDGDGLADFIQVGNGALQRDPDCSSLQDLTERPNNPIIKNVPTSNTRMIQVNPSVEVVESEESSKSDKK